MPIALTSSLRLTKSLSQFSCKSQVMVIKQKTSHPFQKDKRKHVGNMPAKENDSEKTARKLHEFMPSYTLHAGHLITQCSVYARH